VLGSNYSVFGKGKNKLQAVTEEDSSLLIYGAQNNAKGYVVMIGPRTSVIRGSPVADLKLREGREKEIKFCHSPATTAWNYSFSKCPIGCWHLQQNSIRMS
jgi:hypothetical protein